MLNRESLDNLIHVIRIAIPNKLGKETIYLVVYFSLLVLRTYLSIHMSEITGQIVQSIVNKSYIDFLKQVYNTIT